MAGLDSGTEGTVAIAGIDWFAGPSGPDNQADLDLLLIPKLWRHVIVIAMIPLTIMMVRIFILM